MRTRFRWRTIEWQSKDAALASRIRQIKGYILAAMAAGTEFIEEATAGVRRLFPDIPDCDKFVADAIRQVIVKGRLSNSPLGTALTGPVIRKVA